MRLIHHISYSAEEIESYRQLVFTNLTRGLRYLLDALPDLDLELPPAYTNVYPEADPQGRGGYVQGWAPGECGGVSWMGEGLEEEGVKPDELPVRIKPVFPSLRSADAALERDVELIESAPELCDGEPFPLEYLGVRHASSPPPLPSTSSSLMT